MLKLHSKFGIVSFSWISVVNITATLFGALFSGGRGRYSTRGVKYPGHRRKFKVSASLAPCTSVPRAVEAVEGSSRAPLNGCKLPYAPSLFFAFPTRRWGRDMVHLAFCRFRACLSKAMPGCAGENCVWSRISSRLCNAPRVYAAWRSILEECDMHLHKLCISLYLHIMHAKVHRKKWNYKAVYSYIQYFWDTYFRHNTV